MTDEQRQLLIALVSAHLTNLQGDRAAVAEDPALALISAEGIADIDAQIELADSTLIVLSANDA